MTSINRLATANTYDNALRNITQRQSSLSSLQENLTSGKRVVRASDDPSAAAQAERALTRMSRIVTEQRALASQANSIAMAESTLGDVTNALQSFRELVVSAGNGTFTQKDRQTVALQLQGLRDQIFNLSNQKDTNGQPLFSALGSALAPFVGPATTSPDYQFNGLPGQTASQEVAIPFALDGDSAFMLQVARYGAYNITTSGPSAIGSTPLRVNVALTNPPAPVNDSTYKISITSVAPGTLPNTSTAVYTLETTTSGPTPVTTLQAGLTVTDYPTGTLDIPVPGRIVTIAGTPVAGDTATLKPSVSIFSVMDQAIRDIGSATSNAAASQAVGQALGNLDISANRVSAVRGLAGELLNRADRIGANQDKRSIQLEADRSRAEDIDMVKGISDFQNQQTGHQAALQSYALMQKLSLFNYIG